jgi:hypothetical protein
MRIKVRVIATLAIIAGLFVPSASAYATVDPPGGGEGPASVPAATPLLV